MLQGSEPSEQHRELFPGSTALRPDEGIADQKTGEDDVSDGNDGNHGDLKKGLIETLWIVDARCVMPMFRSSGVLIQRHIELKWHKHKQSCPLAH